MKTLIVFCHLRWNFVYQRPQHLLSRLASSWRVIMVEEPVTGSAENHMEHIAAAPGVQVWRPHVSGSAQGFHAEHTQALRALLAQGLREANVQDYWVWFYTPMALAAAAELSPGGIVYDCMDELAAFRNAPLELIAQENQLFEAADVVFTGGRSLHNAKRARHHNIHCFPSSVDAQHFTQVTQDHKAQAHLPHPRLGYCGVIDERIDLPLLDGLARARPEWQVVMVGPLAKISASALPRQPNIHWLGQQSYDDLPAFISGWDVCLLPFALNEATRYISPTKTLEYMACARPSVSTAIADVVDPYAGVVAIEADSAGFVRACDALLARSTTARAAHARDLARVVAQTSWDKTARAMGELIERAESARTVHAVAGERSAVLAR